MINELPGDMQQGLYPQPLKPNGQVFRSELPGDSSFSTATPSPQPSPRQPSYPPDVEKAQSYQAYQGAPQPNQLHPSQRYSASASSSAYSESNTPPQHHRQPSGGPSNNVQEWLGAANGSRNNSTDANSYPQNFSRPSSNLLQPDHQRFSQLSVSQLPHSPRPGPSIPQFAASSMAKCPVCGLFEGDEAAVSHHVSKAHFQ